MIFVTLGTQDKHFGRLLKAVYKLETDEKIVAQIGSTEFKSSKPEDKFEIHKFLSNEEFKKYMDEARVVITHAGVGTIIYGLKKHKKMIVAARLKKYGEHVNEMIINYRYCRHLQVKGILFHLKILMIYQNC